MNKHLLKSLYLFYLVYKSYCLGVFILRVLVDVGVGKTGLDKAAYDEMVVLLALEAFSDCPASFFSSLSSMGEITGVADLATVTGLDSKREETCPKVSSLLPIIILDKVTTGVEVRRLVLNGFLTKDNIGDGDNTVDAPEL